MQGFHYLHIFFLGVLAGAGPCMLKCGMVLVPCVAATRNSFISGVRAALVFASGKAAAYTAICAAAAVSARAIAVFMYDDSVRRFVEYAGIMFIVMLGAYVLIVNRKQCPRYAPYRNISLFALGMSTAAVPCPPFISIIFFLILRQSTLLPAAAAGLAFGAGTACSPLLLLGGISGGLSSRFAGAEALLKWYRIILGAGIMGLGMYRLLGLFQ